MPSLLSPYLRVPLMLGDALAVGEMDELVEGVGDTVPLVVWLGEIEVLRVVLADSERVRVVLAATDTLREGLALMLPVTVEDARMQTVSEVTVQSVPTTYPVPHEVQGVQLLG